MTSWKRGVANQWRKTSGTPTLPQVCFTWSRYSVSSFLYIYFFSLSFFPRQCTDASLNSLVRCTQVRRRRRIVGFEPTVIRDAFTLYAKVSRLYPDDGGGVDVTESPSCSASANVTTEAKVYQGIRVDSQFASVEPTSHSASVKYNHSLRTPNVNLQETRRERNQRHSFTA